VLSVSSPCRARNEVGYGIRSRQHDDVAGMHNCRFGIGRLRHHDLKLRRDDSIFAGDHVPRRLCVPSGCRYRCTKCHFCNWTLSGCRDPLFSSNGITLDQLEPSAQAPWTRMTPLDVKQDHLPHEQNRPRKELSRSNTMARSAVSDFFAVSFGVSHKNVSCACSRISSGKLAHRGNDPGSQC
jgi:hypothetical protein